MSFDKNDKACLAKDHENREFWNSEQKSDWVVLWFS